MTDLAAKKTRSIFSRYWLLLWVLMANMSGANSPTLMLLPFKTHEKPAQSTEKTVFEIDEFARYSIMARSDQGVALQLNDKKQGPSQLYGRAHQEDGRWDGFLERGQYQLITHGSPNNRGKVALSWHKSMALNANDTLPFLPVGNIISTELNDVQHWNYALTLKQRQTVYIEAAGRNLVDLRLWKDGDWLESAPFEKQEIAPVVGEPLNRIRLSKTLEAGTYRVAFYGGAAKKWTQNTSQHPLYIRYGVPLLPAVNNTELSVSPFGEDFYQIPANADEYSFANLFQATLAQPNAFSMTVKDKSATNLFSNNGRHAHIKKESTSKRAQIHYASKHAKYLHVKGEKNQRFKLQYFNAGRQWSDFNSGNYLLTSHYSGEGKNALDSTWLVMRSNWGSTKVVDFKAIDMDLSSRYQRKFNAFKRMSVLLNIKEAGRYQIKQGTLGARAKYRIQPIASQRPKGFRSPAYQSTQLNWSLNKGLYEVSIEPIDRGILELSIEPTAHKGRLQAASFIHHVPWNARFDALYLDNFSQVSVYDNGQTQGLDRRLLPLSLSTPLTLTLMANETWQAPVVFNKNGRLNIKRQSAHSSEVAVQINGRQYRQGERLAAHLSSRTLAIKNTSDDMVELTLAYEFIEKEAKSSPALSYHTFTNDTPLPQVSEGNAHHLTLQQLQSFALRVDYPAFYRIESAGLLSTTGTVRSRLTPAINQKSANGVGRNFLIQEYLLPGDYRLNVAPNGQTKGAASIELNRTPIIDRSSMALNTATRDHLPQGAALLYHLNIEQTGQYHIQSLGLDKTFNIRLDDQDGWPLITPNTPGDLTLTLEKGHYQLMIMPAPLDSRVVTKISALAPPQLARTLAKKLVKGEVTELSVALSHDTRRAAVPKFEWQEIQDAQGHRLPDLFEFELVADIPLNLIYSNSMSAKLMELSTQKPIPLLNSKVEGKQLTWNGTLKKGRYQLALTSIRKNNLFDYSLDLNTDVLFVDQALNVNLPMSLDVKVSERAPIALSSFGSSDVRAQLFLKHSDDSQAPSIQVSDDRLNDWNFLINETLAAGEYRLELESLSEHQHTLVSMKRLKSSVQPRLTLPNGIRFPQPDTPLLNSEIYPLNLNINGWDNKDTLLIKGEADQNLTVFVEQLQNDQWVTIAHSTNKQPMIIIPFDKAGLNSDLRVRLYSPEQRQTHAQLKLSMIKLQEYNEADAAAGIRHWSNYSGMFVFKLALDRAGSFKFESLDNVYAGVDVNKGLVSSHAQQISTDSEYLWLAGAYAELSELEQLKVNRLTLPEHSERYSILLAKNETFAADVKVPSQTLKLIRAEAQSHTPSVYFAENHGVDVANSAVSLSDKSSVAVFINEEAKAEQASLRLSHPSSRAHQSTVALHSLELTLDPAVEYASNHRGKLVVGKTKTITLAPELQRYHVTLPAESAVIFRHDNQTLDSFYAGAQGAEFVFMGVADQVMLLLTTTEQAITHGLYQIQAKPLQTPMVVSQDSALSYAFQHNATVHIPVMAADHNTVLSSLFEVEYVRSNGVRQTGKRFELPAVAKASFLSFSERPPQGYVKLTPQKASLTQRPAPHILWLQPKEDRQALADKVKLLPSELSVNEMSEWYTLNSPRAQQLTLYSDTAILMQTMAFAANEQKITTTYLNAHRDHDVAFAQGQHAIRFIEWAPKGGAEVTLAWTEATPLNEGMGKAVLISSAQTMLYEFQINNEDSGSDSESFTRRFGLGLQSENDTLNAELFDQTGALLAQGNVFSVALASGHYHIKITLPKDQNSIVFKPVSFGIEAKPDGPPEDLLKRYLQTSQ